MKTSPLLHFAVCGLAFAAVATLASAAPRSSANYEITAEIADLAGQRMTSANYTNDSSVSAVTGISTVSAPPQIAKHGYAGQLYEVQGLAVTATPSTVNETGTTQLTASPLLDDGTTLLALNATSVSWSVVSGPLNSISAEGLGTAANVFQDTAALAAGAFQNLSGQTNISVLNTGSDDLGIYAGDGIDDDWQVQFFGENNPNAAPGFDADGSGHGNRFKFVAGLNPLDGSRFTLAIEAVSGQPSQMRLIFRPLVAGRTYEAEYSDSIGPWSPLEQSLQSDNASERTVTDVQAFPAPRFYRIEISKP